jgi:hemoglobin-like flavoprotein
MVSRHQKCLRVSLLNAVETLVHVTSDVWRHAWSIKYRLITKLNTQIETNLQDEFLSQRGAIVNIC